MHPLTDVFLCVCCGGPYAMHPTEIIGWV